MDAYDKIRRTTLAVRLRATAVQVAAGSQSVASRRQVRPRSNRAKAKAAGKYKGRPPSIDRLRELLTRMGPADVAKTMRIARSTVYKLGFDA